MTDPLTPKQRSNAMKAVRATDTFIELRLRRALWHRGHRYRKDYREVPGRPDIAFVGPKIAVFCDSEFWHGLDWENRKYDIKSKRDYWWPKIERNIERDREVNQKLSEMGWQVLRFWGSEIEHNIEDCVDRIETALDKRDCG